MKNLKLVIESAPYAMIISDEKGAIVFANKQADVTFGYDREELHGQLIEVLLPKSLRSKHKQDRAQFNSRPSTRAMGAGRDLFGIRKNGSQVPVEIGLTPIETDEGRMVLATIIDISERKRMEAERQRLEQEVLEATEVERKRIGQELHDSLGQQLLGIAFLSDALRERLHQKSLPDAADAKHIADLIQKVMQQARELSRGLYAAELEAHGIVEALKQLVVNVNATTNIQCQLVCDLSVAFEDKEKAGHIYRIAQEALNNALRHSLATQIVLTITKDAENFGLEIKDNGIGFSNAGPSSGMGLKIMRYRADIIGGTFNAAGEVGSGSIISITVPLKKAVVSV